MASDVLREDARLIGGGDHTLGYDSANGCDVLTRLTSVPVTESHARSLSGRTGLRFNLSSFLAQFIVVHGPFPFWWGKLRCRSAIPNHQSRRHSIVVAQLRHGGLGFLDMVALYTVQSRLLSLLSLCVTTCLLQVVARNDIDDYVLGFRAGTPPCGGYLVRDWGHAAGSSSMSFFRLAQEGWHEWTCVAAAEESWLDHCFSDNCNKSGACK